MIDKGIYKLDPKKKYKPMRSIIPFQQVEFVHLSYLTCWNGMIDLMGLYFFLGSNL